MRVFTGFEARGGGRPVVGVGLTVAEVTTLQQQPLVLNGPDLPCGVVIFAAEDAAAIDANIALLLETNPVWRQPEAQA